MQSLGVPRWRFSWILTRRPQPWHFDAALFGGLRNVVWRRRSGIRHGVRIKITPEVWAQVFAVDVNVSIWSTLRCNFSNDRAAERYSL
jgi:hypothetical protein